MLLIEVKILIELSFKSKKKKKKRKLYLWLQVLRAIIKKDNLFRINTRVHFVAGCFIIPRIDEYPIVKTLFIYAFGRDTHKPLIYFQFYD